MFLTFHPSAVGLVRVLCIVLTSSFPTEVVPSTWMSSKKKRKISDLVFDIVGSYISHMMFFGAKMSFIWGFQTTRCKQNIELNCHKIICIYLAIQTEKQLWWHISKTGFTFDFFRDSLESLSLCLVRKKMEERNRKRKRERKKKERERDGNWFLFNIW